MGDLLTACTWSRSSPTKMNPYLRTLMKTGKQPETILLTVKQKVLFCNILSMDVISAVNHRKQLAALTESFHDYVCKVADKSFLLLKEKRRFSRREAEQQMDRPDFSTLVPRRVQPSSGLIPWEDLPRYCPYGEMFYRRFSEWYITIQWPVDAGDGVMGYISLLELYFNFVVCTGTETPVSTAKRGKPANYKLLDQDVLLQAKTWSLSQHTRVWCPFLELVLKVQHF